jgi:hypothetical protein
MAFQDKSDSELIAIIEPIMDNLMDASGSSAEAALSGAVMNLALPGDQALELQPQDSDRPARLAHSFDESYTEFISNLAALPTDAQLQSLQALDSALNAMSGAAYPELCKRSTNRMFPAAMN